MSNHLHLGTRLFLGFALILVLLGAVVGIGISQRSANDAMASQELPAVQPDSRKLRCDPLAVLGVV